MLNRIYNRKSTKGTTIAAIEANNDTYYLQKEIEKFPLIKEKGKKNEYSLSIIRNRVETKVFCLTLCFTNLFITKKFGQ